MSEGEGGNMSTLPTVTLQCALATVPNRRRYAMCVWEKGVGGGEEAKNRDLHVTEFLCARLIVGPRQKIERNFALATLTDPWSTFCGL